MGRYLGEKECRGGGMGGIGASSGKELRVRQEYSKESVKHVVELNKRVVESIIKA